VHAYRRTAAPPYLTAYVVRRMIQPRTLPQWQGGSICTQFKGNRISRPSLDRKRDAHARMNKLLARSLPLCLKNLPLLCLNDIHQCMNTYTPDQRHKITSGTQVQD
jgi:hypothetical protein